MNAQDFRDPKPYKNPANGDRYGYRDAWPSMVNLDLVPRTLAQYEADEASSDAGSDRG